MRYSNCIVKRNYRKKSAAYRLAFVAVLACVGVGFAYAIWRDNQQLAKYLHDDYSFSKSVEQLVAINSITTPGGNKLYFARIAAAELVDIEVIFDAGSTRDGDKLGLSELVFLALNFNNLPDCEQVFEELDAIGATVNITHDRDKVKIAIRCLNSVSHLQQAINVVTKALAKPNLTASSLVQAKLQLQDKIKQDESLADSLAMSLLYRNLYKGHPYANKDNISTASISAVTVKDVTTFHQQYYVAENASVAMAGDIAADVAGNLADQFLNNLSHGNSAGMLPKISGLHHNKIIVNKIQHATQSQIIIGALGIAKHSPDFFPFLVGNCILGDSVSESRLMHTLRVEQGFAYNADTDFQTMTEVGPFWVSVATSAENSEQILKNTKLVLENFINNGPTDEELQFAKRYLIGALPLYLSSAHDVVNITSEMAYYKLSPEFMHNYQNSLHAVTKQQVKDVFAKILQPNKVVTIVVSK